MLWVFFAAGYLAKPGAWQDVPAVAPSSAAVGGVASTMGYIVLRNCIVLLLIGVGNLLVRFGVVTPGLLVLIVQGAAIGWLAGTNGFEVPFPSVAAANMQYLRIGLWETSAYAVFCGLTLTKSLLVADSFPAKEWAEKAYSALFEVFRCRKGTGSLDAASFGGCGLGGGLVFGEVKPMFAKGFSFQPQQLNPLRMLHLVEL